MWILCYDKNAEKTLSENYIKELHFLLKTGTSDSRRDWFRVGDYKKLPNEVGGVDTTAPEDVSREMRVLLASYNKKETVTLEDIIEFHVAFERIHPFQDGNGRVGRLIMFKECLKHNKKLSVLQKINPLHNSSRIIYPLTDISI